MRFSSSLSFCRCEDGYPEKSSGLSWSHKASLHQKVAKGPPPHQKNRMPRYQAPCVHICLFTCWFYTSLNLEPLIMMTVKTSVCGRRGRGRKFGSGCCWDVPISMHRQLLELRGSNCAELQSWKSSPRWNEGREVIWTVIFTQPSWVEQGPTHGPIFPIPEVKADRQKVKIKNTVAKGWHFKKILGSKSLCEHCYFTLLLTVTTSHMSPSKATVKPTKEIEIWPHFPLINRRW